MLSRITTVGVIVLCLLSCTRQDCILSHQNKILSTQSYDSTAYQAELYKLIKKHPDVVYYFETHEEIAGKKYLVVNAYGDAFCGKLRLVINKNDLDRINELASSENYKGAQLIGLRFAKSKTASGDALVYQSLAYIVE